MVEKCNLYNGRWSICEKRQIATKLIRGMITGDFAAIVIVLEAVRF